MPPASAGPSGTTGGWRAASPRSPTSSSPRTTPASAGGAWGLTIWGRRYGAAAGQPERRYYRCAGKDCIETAGPAACPSRSVKAEAIEAAVWEHVAGLLADPDRLLAQFDRFAAVAEAGSAPG